MNFDLNVDIEKREIYIKNINSHHLDVYFIDYNKNYGIYRCGLNKNMWGITHLPTDTDVCYIYINDNNVTLKVIQVKLYEKNYEIVYINKTDYFDFNSPFIFFGGHTGGGTSIVVKALRAMGLHFGDDCGLFENRKPHESASMRVWVYSIDDKNELRDEKNKLLDVISVYGYKNNQINCFKVPGDEKNKVASKIIRITQILPNIKIVSVIRKQNNFYSSFEGENFNTKKQIDVFENQFFPLEGTPVFHLDFYKFFTEYTYFNKILKYIGSDNLLENEEHLEKIKEIIKFDNKVLL